MIAITGATGNVGGRVADELLAAGKPVRVLVRNAARAQARFGGRAEIAEADLDVEESLAAPLAGVEKVFLMSASDDPVRQYIAMARAAARAGVRHLVMLSAMGADQRPPITMLRWFQDGEEQVRAAGVAWTFVRPSGFMSNILPWAEMIRAQGAVFQPTGDGTIAYIDPRDIAAVIAAALSDASYEGRALEITGPEPLSGTQVTARIAAAVGRPLRFVDVSPEQARQGMLRGGMAPGTADAVLEFLGRVKAGEFGTVTGTVAQVLGRPPRTLDQWLGENLAAFR